jgi:opacity protein-like surface antigen
MNFKNLALFTTSALLTLASGAQAFDVVEAGKPVVTGEPSRVGPPWNHRSTFNVPGTQTDVAFGGYVKFDATYDTDFDLGGPVIDPFNLRNSANKTDGRAEFSANESRINFRTNTKTNAGPVKTYVEAHFVPNGGLSLRHAYGEWNNILAGQTWTNYMSFVGATRTIRLGDPSGFAFIRQGQVRYSTKFNEHFLAVSLEDPSTVVADGDAGTAQGEPGLPDFTVRYEYKRNFALSGIVRQLSTNEEFSSIDDEVIGAGVQTMFSIPLGAATSLKGVASYGSGVGDLFGEPANSARRNMPDVYVDGQSLETVDVVAYGAHLNHYWNPKWFSSIGASRLDLDLPDDARFSSNIDTLDYAWVNLIWDPTDRVMIGIEYQYIEMAKVSAPTLDASRLQASFRFQF